MDDKLEIKLGNLELKNPILLASGTAGYGDDNPSANIVGAIITKGLSLKPREGNPPPRIWETPSGVLNSIGLENGGVENFLKERIPEIKKSGVAIVANIFGETEDEYAELANTLSHCSEIKAIEINASCPNVEKGALSFCSSPYTLAGLVDAVRSKTNLPLIVKLPPRDNIVGLAKSAISVGANIISLINTYPAMIVDIEKQKPVFKKGGGLAGPAIMPIAIKKTWELASEIDDPIIAGGGIMSAEDALQFIMAGANAVTIGSAAMVSPFLPEEILSDLEKYLYKNEIKNISKLIGVARV